MPRSPSKQTTRRGARKKLELKEEFELRRFREAGVSIAACAGYFHVSEATVFRVLREQRRKFGPEKFPYKHRARWHLTARSEDIKQAQAPISEDGVTP